MFRATGDLMMIRTDGASQTLHRVIRCSRTENEKSQDNFASSELEAGWGSRGREGWWAHRLHGSP